MATSKQEFPLQKYFKKIGIPLPFLKTFEPSVGSLYLVVNKHATSFHFQNVEMFQFKSLVDLTIPGLEERLLDNNKGGFCFELSELLGHALTALNFEVHRVVTNVGEFSKRTRAPPNHNVLFVKIDKRWFLVDIGFGYNSIRFPVELNLKETQETEAFPWEKFKFEVNDDHFQMRLWMKEAWFPMYWFPRNKAGEFDGTDATGAAARYKAMLEHQDFLIIRDGMIRIDKMHESGKLGFMYSKQNIPENDFAKKGKPFVGHFQSQDKPEFTEVEYETEKEFCEAIRKHLGLELDQAIFKLK